MLAVLALQAGRVFADTLPGNALPANGQVVAGSGSIASSGSVLTVNQSSDKLTAQWDSFNIGSAAKVNFVQPSRSSIALNRVMSGDPSRIYGQLNANGQVFLVNAAGILFAAGSSINVGGLVASTLDISNADFAAGNMRFTNSSGASGQVLNQGTLTASEGGYVALIGPQVANEGAINAHLGTVALGAGNAVTLDMHGDGLLNLQVDGAALAALASNSGTIQADGGLVMLAAAHAGGDPLATVLNNSGTVQARSLSNRNGVIRLEGGGSGVVASAARLTPRATAPARRAAPSRCWATRSGCSPARAWTPRATPAAAPCCWAATGRARAASSARAQPLSMPMRRSRRTP
jgi:filamentous hemagglutinin family protein